MTIEANDGNWPALVGQKDDEKRKEITRMLKVLHGGKLQQLYDFTYRLYTKC